MMTTGEKIKALRIAKGMTQAELAEKLGVKVPAIHKYESGIVVNLKRSTIEKLSAILGVDPLYLMGWADGSEAKENPPSGESGISPIRKQFIDYADKFSDDELQYLMGLIDVVMKKRDS